LADIPLLEVESLQTGYGKKQVLYGVSLEVRPGEVVALIGPNGSGKSTALKAISGLLPAWSGIISLDGVNLRGARPSDSVARGLAFSPQGNRVFAELTVRENLEIGGFRVAPKELRDRMEEMVEFFPILKARSHQLAGRLSGGERQVVSLARALIPKPKLLMLDEPSLGLFSGLLKDVFDLLVRINAETGTAMLIVEQKVQDVLAISRRVYALKLGRVVWSGGSADLIGDPTRLKDIFL
jgi:branched-chain amino acid transport system ATP-binding protein